jgi:hypothetical protein
MEPIEIKFNRKKIVLILLLCLAFSYLCWNFVVDQEHYTSYRHRHRDTGFIFLAGLFGFIFFGAGNLVLLKMLFRRNPALIIDEKGITDYSTFMSVGLIHWEDITAIKGGKLKSTHFITIHIKNKKKYIANSKNAWQTYMMKINSKYFRTPIHINSSGLQCKHDELMAIILKAQETYKSNHDNTQQHL